MAKSQSTGSGDGGFEAFFAAIGGQESGGDYNARNARTGASGRFQIMPANIGPWSQQYLGKRISVEEFRRSPQLQDRLARAVLYSYYTKYGARGAAAAWYSGKPGRANDYSSIGHGGEPSVGAYVDSVLGRIGKTPTTTSTQPVQSGTPDGTLLSKDPSQGKTQPTLWGSNIGPGLAGSAQDPFGGGGKDPFGTQVKSTGQTAAVPAAQINTAVATGPKPGESASEFRDRIITEAMKYIGVPYVWGGTGPKGFDCSGIIKYVYGKLGYSMPRISAAQANSGNRVDIGSLREGDLVAWDNSSRNNGADHIAIYAGNGYIIEAPHAGADVRRRKLGANEGAWGVSLGLPGD